MQEIKYVVLIGFLAMATMIRPCAAQSSVMIYGVLQTAVEEDHISGASNSSAVASAASNTSRIPTYGSFIGFRGKEELGGDLSTIFQLESYVFMNGQQPAGFNPFNSRNTRVGLESKQYGTVFAGVWDTPLRDLLSQVPFPGTTFDPGPFLANGIGNTVANGQAPASFERRQTDTVAYWSPVIDGFQARIHSTLNDGSTGSTGEHLLSARGSYTSGPVTLMTAYETHHDYGGLGTKDQAIALYGNVAVGRGHVGAIYTNLSYQRVVNGGTGDLHTNNWMLFGNYPLGSGALNIAYIRSGSGSGSLSGLGLSPSGRTTVNSAMYVGEVTSGGETGANTYEIGYDYYLSKRTKLFADVMYLKNEAHGAYVPFGSVPTTPGALGLSQTVVGLGILTSF